MPYLEQLAMCSRLGKVKKDRVVKRARDKLEYLIEMRTLLRMWMAELVNSAE